MNPSFNAVRVRLSAALCVLVVVFVFVSLRAMPFSGVRLCLDSIPEKERVYDLWFSPSGAFTHEHRTRAVARKTNDGYCAFFNTGTIPEDSTRARFDFGDHAGVHVVDRVLVYGQVLFWSWPMAQWPLNDIVRSARNHNHVSLHKTGDQLVVRATGVDPYFETRFDQAALVEAVPRPRILVAKSLWILALSALLLSVLWGDRLLAGGRHCLALDRRVSGSIPAAAMHWFMAIGIAFGALAAANLALHRGFDHDEIETVHSAWLVQQGQLIYRDFFQHHHPLFYGLLAPIVGVLGESARTLVTLRGVPLLFMLLSVVSVYRIGAAQYGRLAGLGAALLAGSSLLYVQSAIEIRPDTAHTASMMLGFLFLLGTSRRPPRWAYAVSGICFGLALVFLQKAVFGIAAAGLVVLYRWYRREIGFRELMAGAGGLVLPGLVMMGWVLAAGIWDDYWVVNWLLNARFISRFDALLTLQGVTPWDGWIWALGLLGALLAIGSRNRRRLEVLVCGIVLIGAAYASPNPYGNYFMPGSLFVAILGGGALQFLVSRYPVISISLLCLFWARQMVEMVDLPRDGRQIRQLAQIEYVLAATDKSDFVYDGNAYFNLYRKDLDYFWYALEQSGGLGSYQALRPYTYDFTSLVQQKRPKIVSTYNLTERELQYLERHYTRSPVYRDLYLRNDANSR